MFKSAGDAGEDVEHLYGSRIQQHYDQWQHNTQKRLGRAGGRGRRRGRPAGGRTGTEGGGEDARQKVGRKDGMTE